MVIYISIYVTIYGNTRRTFANGNPCPINTGLSVFMGSRITQLPLKVSHFVENFVDNFVENFVDNFVHNFVENIEENF